MQKKSIEKVCIMCEKRRHLCGSRAHLSAVRTIGVFNVPIGDNCARRLYIRKRVHMNPQGRLHMKSGRRAPARMQESDACASHRGACEAHWGASEAQRSACMRKGTPVTVRPILGAPLMPIGAPTCQGDIWSQGRLHAKEGTPACVKEAPLRPKGRLHAEEERI